MMESRLYIHLSPNTPFFCVSFTLGRLFPECNRVPDTPGVDLTYLAPYWTHSTSFPVIPIKLRATSDWLSWKCLPICNQSPWLTESHTSTVPSWDAGLNPRDGVEANLTQILWAGSKWTALPQREARLLLTYRKGKFWVGNECLRNSTGWSWEKG